MKYGSMEIQAYRDVDGSKVDGVPELAAWLYVVRNGAHVFGAAVLELEGHPDALGSYGWLPIAVSETDDVQIVFTNFEEDPHISVTVYGFFFNASGNPVGTGFAVTLGHGPGPNDKGQSAVCSVKTQTGW